MRFARRVVVSGQSRAGDGTAWCEQTETSDVSASGAFFQLNQRVSCGERLRLRAHLPDGAVVEVRALIIRVAPASYSLVSVGVQIIERNEVWVGLFSAWVANERGVVSGRDATLAE